MEWNTRSNYTWISTCGTFYLTLTQITIVQIVNIFLGVTLYWFLYLLLGRSTRAIGLGNIVIGVLGAANYYLMKFQGAPFQLADFKSAGTAANVVKNYDFRPDVLLIIGILDLILWYLMWRGALTEEKKKERRWNPVVIAVTVVVSCGCIAIALGKYDKVYAETTQFSQITYLAALLAEAIGSRQILSEDYSAEEVEKIVAVYREGVKLERLP